MIFCLLIGIGSFFSITSCQPKSPSSDDQIIATAFNETLELSEVESILGPNMTKQDSFLFIKEYIDHWVQKQVILNKAKENDLATSDEIAKKVENYRQDLIAFEYCKKLVAEKLDTNLTLGETKTYYASHPENFELKQNIVQFVFIKMPKGLENKHKFWSKFANASNEAHTKMAIIALKNGGSAFLERDKWVAFDDVLKAVPITTYNQESFINNTRIFKIEESAFVWYIRILDFKLKETVSPFEFVEENITQILLNKRKVVLMKKIEEQMVNQAIKDNHVKINLPHYD